MSEPIDFVYTWVDGEQNDALKRSVTNEAAGSASNRFRDNSELKHSIASVRAFAPWVRKIFVVAADGQTPKWLTRERYPEVEVVHHSRVFGDHVDGLPVFNSHAIESVLHQIPGLSERFVYFNDDMFLGAPVKPEDFFDVQGRAVVRVSEEITARWLRHRKAWRVYRGRVRLLLSPLFPGARFYNSAHQARTLLRSSCQAAWDSARLGEPLSKVARARFRTSDDFAPIELFSNWMLLHNEGVISQESGEVLCIFDHSLLAAELWALRQSRPRFYCINDDMVEPSEEHLASLKHYLSTRLPHHQGGPRIPSRRVARAIRRLADFGSKLNRFRRDGLRAFQVKR